MIGWILGRLAEVVEELFTVKSVARGKRKRKDILSVTVTDKEGNVLYSSGDRPVPLHLIHLASGWDYRFLSVKGKEEWYTLLRYGENYVIVVSSYRLAPIDVYVIAKEVVGRLRGFVWEGL